MMILLLGGTQQAKSLAQSLSSEGYAVTYSVAGLVRQPELSCEVISGGFTQFGGLVNYIQQHDITQLIDATHPYAQTMSAKAAQAAQQCGIPYWRFQRPAWQAQAEDDWRLFMTWAELVCEGLVVADYQQVLLTQGQLDTQALEQLEAMRQPDQYFWLRTAVTSKVCLPDWIKPIINIGPFSFVQELALLRELNIDVLVSKNSGGEATYSKLLAARKLGLPVLMLQRPRLCSTAYEFADVLSLLNALRQAATRWG